MWRVFVWFFLAGAKFSTVHDSSLISFRPVPTIFRPTMTYLKQMIAVALCWVIFGFASASGAGIRIHSGIDIQEEVPDFATCDANTTCPIGEYCLDGFCEMCVPCESRGRESPPSVNGISCAKTEAECGSCLPGYQEDALTNGIQLRSKCSLSRPTSSTTDEWILTVILVFLAILVVFMVLIIYMLINIKSSLLKLTKNHDTNPVSEKTQEHSVSVPVSNSVQNEVELKSFKKTKL